MRRNELDFILSRMLESQQEVSDLNFTTDKPLQVESFGELVPVDLDPPITTLSPFQTEMVALNLIGGSRRLTEELLRSGSCDSSYSVSNKARFRVNIFSQRGNYSVVLRKLNTKVPTLEELSMPDIFLQVAKEKTGLVLVTGATGSGKTTTLAALLNQINESKSVHVITLEDPVEFVHPQKRATFNQRELGTDFNTFSTGLRSALRQAPKVILVGEMRDRETLEIGLTAAETGHLVLATLHTIDAGQTINPLLELMGSNLRTKESIVQGESEGKTFYEIIEANHTFGWRTFDHAALDAFEHGRITEETALLYCTRRSIVSRGIDNVKKRRGESTSDVSSLRMRTSEDKKASGPPVPATFKLK